MPTPFPSHLAVGVALRGGAHAELVGLADAVLGSGRRLEVPLLEVAQDAGEPDRRPVDVVWAGPDDAALLHHDDALGAALLAARTRLRAGGLVLLPAPGVAELKTLHAVAPVAVQVGVHGSVGPVGVWDFTVGGPRTYTCHVLQLQRTEREWSVQAAQTTWFEVPTEPELRTALTTAGFQGAQRLPTGETGLAYPVWAAVAPSSDRATSSG